MHAIYNLNHSVDFFPYDHFTVVFFQYIFLQECNFQQFCENFRTSQLVQLAYCNLSPSSYQSLICCSAIVWWWAAAPVDPTLHISHTWGKLLLAFCWRSSNWAENENLFFLPPSWVLQILLVQIHHTWNGNVLCPCPVSCPVSSIAQLAAISSLHHLTQSSSTTSEQLSNCESVQYLNWIDTTLMYYFRGFTIYILMMESVCTSVHHPCSD